jgi:hypothetical protein
VADTDADDPWLTTGDVAKRLRMSESGLRTWRHNGEGPKYAKRGKLVRYRRSWITDFEADMVAAGEHAREVAQSFQHRGAA